MIGREGGLAASLRRCDRCGRRGAWVLAELQQARRQMRRYGRPRSAPSQLAHCSSLGRGDTGSARALAIPVARHRVIALATVRWSGWVLIGAEHALVLLQTVLQENAAAVPSRAGGSDPRFWLGSTRRRSRASAGAPGAELVDLLECERSPNAGLRVAGGQRSRGSVLGSEPGPVEGLVISRHRWARPRGVLSSPSPGATSGRGWVKRMGPTGGGPAVGVA